MKFDFLIPYIHLLVYFLIGLFVLYIKTLIIEKAKRRILIKKNRILTEESENIKSRHNKEIEKLRKEHQLDLEKRKYQYDSKQKEYIAFFKFLDYLGGDYNIKTQQKMIPIIQEFTTNFFSVSEDNNSNKQHTVSAIYVNKIHELMQDANTELTRMKQETNTIRLLASDTVIQKLDLLDNAYDTAFTETSKMLSDLPDQLIINDQVAMKRSQDRIEIKGKQFLKIKDDLIQLMRLDLNTI